VREVSSKSFNAEIPSEGFPVLLLSSMLLFSLPTIRREHPSITAYLLSHNESKDRD
jgi:hypothetical protein